MNTKEKTNLKNWTREERDNIVNAFAWLIRQDKKQNPDFYIAKNNNEKKTS